MCIRDSTSTVSFLPLPQDRLTEQDIDAVRFDTAFRGYRICLLYTSDAADERSSVDLGGRRIIKNKQQITTMMCRGLISNNDADLQHTQL